MKAQTALLVDSNALTTLEALRGHAEQEERGETPKEEQDQSWVVQQSPVSTRPSPGFLPKGS